jgi:hypothetical protein
MARLVLSAATVSTPCSGDAASIGGFYIDLGCAMGCELKKNAGLEGHIVNKVG